MAFQSQKQINEQVNEYKTAMDLKKGNYFVKWNRKKGRERERERKSANVKKEILKLTEREMKCEKRKA